VKKLTYIETVEDVENKNTSESSILFLTENSCAQDCGIESNSEMGRKKRKLGSMCQGDRTNGYKRCLCCRVVSCRLSVVGCRGLSVVR